MNAKKLLSALGLVVMLCNAAAAETIGDVPSKFNVPWGNQAGANYIRAIPQASQIGIQNCAASLTDGFPPLTFVPAAQGGCPPFGQDFNGIFKQISQWSRWNGMGTPVIYDSAFSSQIGGYPKYSMLSVAATPGCYWVSNVDNNTSDPDTGGANWVNTCLTAVYSVTNSDGSLTISPNSGAVVAGINTAHANNWGAAQTFSGGVYFGGGDPWVDVKSGSNGCAKAFGNGSNVDTAAIQCQINYMEANFGGGIVFFPPGTYLVDGGVSGGVNVPAGIWLEGTGVNSTAITVTAGSNTRPLAFSITGGTCPSGNHNGGMEKIAVYGDTNPSTVGNNINIGADCNVTLRDDRILYGEIGLVNAGVDSVIDNCFIWGWSGAVQSSGANWYIRDKLDQPGSQGAGYAFFQTTPISGLVSAENHLIHIDMTGDYTNSLVINDGSGNNSILTVTNSVFSSPILITNAETTIFGENEIGSTSFTASGNVVVIGNAAVSQTAISGGNIKCAANVRITGC